MYVEDIAHLVWDILRLRRNKAAIVNLAVRPALEEIVTQLSIKPGNLNFHVKDDSKNLA